MILPHFTKLRKELKISGWEDKSETIQLSREGFKMLLQGYVKSECETFDSTWYLKNYPDIAKSIVERVIPSAKEHYVKYGYIEGRFPGFKDVDIEQYIKIHLDLENKIGHISKTKRHSAAMKHIVEFGYKEGREIPSKL